VERMKKYEIISLIRPNVDEEGKKNIIEKINNVFVKAASTVSEVKEWGLRELAYEIDGETKGYYVLLNVEATPEAVKEFDRVANIDEAVIRHIVIAL
jgi:small subunit ribosomal protein S6